MVVPAGEVALRSFKKQEPIRTGLRLMTSGNPTVNFHGDTSTFEPAASTTIEPELSAEVLYELPISAVRISCC